MTRLTKSQKTSFSKTKKTGFHITYQMFITGATTHVNDVIKVLSPAKENMRIKR